MSVRSPHDDDEALDLPRPSSFDLRGKQSVRATFRLSARAIDALSILAVHLGIKQKSLFEHLIEDSRSLSLIAQEMEPSRFEQISRVQKTFVLSRRTLGLLQQACEMYDAPRDALVEYSIQRLLPVIAEERQRHEIRKQFLARIQNYVDRGEELLENAAERLGAEDPVHASLEQALRAVRAAQADIEQFIAKGRIIEEY
jgi:hypothetical protein